MTGVAIGNESESEEGFTLIEALVSISLVGLITLVVFVGLRLGNESWARTDRLSLVSGEVAAAQRILRQAIEQSYPGMAPQAGAPTVVTFHGAASALEVAAPIASELAVGGRHRLYLQHAPAESELTIAWVPERGQGPSGVAPPDAQKATLLPGVRSLTFGYFGLLAGEREARWHDKWIGQQSLPKLVRVEARLADGAVPWMALDAAPRLDVDATCTLDPLSHRCRGR